MILTTIINVKNKYDTIIMVIIFVGLLYNLINVVDKLLFISVKLIDSWLWIMISDQKFFITIIIIGNRTILVMIIFVDKVNISFDANLVI